MMLLLFAIACDVLVRSTGQLTSVFDMTAPVPTRALKSKTQFSQELFSERRSDGQPSGLRQGVAWISDWGEPGMHSMPAAVMTLSPADSRNSRGRHDPHSLDKVELRAAQHTLLLNSSSMELRPDIALKSNSGAALGFSVAASGHVLALGFGRNALVSSNAQNGGHFYKYSWSIEAVSAGQESYPLAVASEDMACFSFPQRLECLVLDHAARAESTAPWTPTPAQTPRTPAGQNSGCPWKVSQVCTGEAAAAWKLATATVVNTSAGLRYVSTHFARKAGSTYDWQCTSGCGSSETLPGSNITSYDASFGKALAMHGQVLAVGSPGVNGANGRVDVYFARATADASGYGEHKWWELVSTLPPPPTLVQGVSTAKYSGQGGFGSTLSLSSKWLAIGAPGNATVAALVRIYKVTGSSISHFCEVKHPSAATNSRFGFTIAQDSHTKLTTMLIGAPGENKVYSLLVRDAPPLCQVQGVLLPEQADSEPKDEFGYSVAYTKHFAFIGAPFYYRWYKQADGLLYVSAFCLPGSVRPVSPRVTQSSIPECSVCSKDETSDGGTSTTCRKCAVKIPQQASLDYGCSFTCHVGYFGESCLKCSQYATSLGWTKKNFSAWVDGETTCYSRCIGGYRDDAGTCGECPQTAEYNLRMNVEWIGSSADAMSRGRKLVWNGELEQWNLGPPLRWKKQESKPMQGGKVKGREVENVKLSTALANRETGVFTTEEWISFGLSDTQQDDFIQVGDSYFVVQAVQGLPDVMPSRISCAYQCKMGYFEHRHPDTGAAACYTCKDYQRNKLGNSPPANGEYVDGQPLCGKDNWAAKLGYNCTYDPILNPDSVCAQCKDIPLQASFVATRTAPLSREKCDFDCNTNYFGHPTYPGVCVECGKLQTDYAKQVLPKNSRWLENPTICNSSSWTCNAGFSKADPQVTSQRFCCPDVLANSYPDPTYEPCGRACNASFFFNNETATCDKCETASTPNKKQNHVWLRDCDFNCKCAASPGECFYGKAELSNCYKCDKYHELMNTAIPPNAYWLSSPFDDGTGTGCDLNAWKCPSDKYVKSLTAEPPGCCPLALPYSSVIKVDSSNDHADTCNYKCIDYYQWDKVEKNCTKKTVDKIPNSEWNYRTGAWECLPGFKSLPEGFPQPHKCMECSVYAQNEEWTLPANGHWLNSSEIKTACAESVCRGKCVPEAFACSGNLVKNPRARLCCPPEGLPAKVLDKTHENGVWDSTKCEYRCDVNQDGQRLFPVVPTPTDAVCMTCDEYLKKNQIPNSCQSTDPTWCSQNEIEMNPNPSSCTASLQMNWKVEGVTKQDFRVLGLDNVMLAALAQLVGHHRSNTLVTSVAVKRESAGVGRRFPHTRSASEDLDLESGSVVDSVDISDWEDMEETAVLAGRRASSTEYLSVGVLMRYLHPLNTIAKKDKLGLKATEEVKNAVNRAGSTATFSLVGSIIAGPSSEVLKCTADFTLNPSTGRCCRSSRYRDPAGTPQSRYMWKENGCEWECLKGFSGAKCLTCTESNKDKYKPDNSVWDDNSDDCTTWKCLAGYVLSDDRQRCYSLKQLKLLCAAKTRCATCLEQSNCVWCKDKCVPGEEARGASLGSSDGCPYVADSDVLGQCKCEKKMCLNECQHTSCSACVKDAYCGWCAASEKCMLGSFFRPSYAGCSSGWSSGTGTRCSSDGSIWMIGLVSASVSTMLVLLMCMHFILRMRAANRLPPAPILPFGSAPQGAENVDQARQIMTRFLETFPTFKYDGRRGKKETVDAHLGMATPGSRGPTETSAGPRLSVGQDGAVGEQPPADQDEGGEFDPGDDEPVCSICLGNFVDGEECRMLPCLHVFHKACIDHWFNVSQECPLCKRSVMHTSTNNTANRSTNFAAQQSRFGTESASQQASTDIAV